MRTSLTVYACALLSVLPATMRAESPTPVSTEAKRPAAISMVVMDPLAAPLSCPCVEGYAQRDYQTLADHLSLTMGCPVTVTFAESLSGALKKKSCPQADLVIGKDSVVRYDLGKLGQAATVVGRLTDQEGSTTQTGMVVVRSADKAQSVSDLRGYRILFGPAECEEKFAAPRQLLTEAGIELPSLAESEVSGACSDGACKILDWGDTEQAAAVISSYAAPLLEGCGTINKGDLRVVGQTAPTPFVTAFASDTLSEEDANKIRRALLSLHEHPSLLLALESLMGFVEPDKEYVATYGLQTAPPQTTKRAVTAEPGPESSESAAWHQFRGPTGDGRVAWLPDTLPAEPEVLWRLPMNGPGLGGIAATDELVLVGDRDPLDGMDYWHCLDARDGSERWALFYPAIGKLDYGNTPRATPLIAGGKAYLLGAFGDLHCVELETGHIIWSTNLRDEFSATHELVWGTCSSPQLIDGQLMVSPGGPGAAWVALDPETGQEQWRGAGDRHAYAAPLLVDAASGPQFVAYDRTSLGGWDIATGNRLWTFKPPYEGDFNVPSPLLVDGKLLLVSENNSARLHALDQSGRPQEEPAAFYRRLSPDMSSPVLVADRIFCVEDRLFCLNAHDLGEVWVGGRRDFASFASLIASDTRLLTIGRGGDLLLIDATADAYRVVSRSTVFKSGGRSTEILSQPAVVGERLYARGEKELVCVSLAD